MIPPPDKREEWILREAQGRPAAERAVFLDGACSGDVALRQRLEALLAAHGQPETLLATQAGAVRPTIELDLADAPDEAVGQTLGGYKLLECIGEGGCGVVYVAEQTQPVRRRVALKVIKLGMDTKQVVARFEAERQALAMMDHPNIAKVLDAGTTEVGRPFFVMELVRGVRLTDFCDEHQLRTVERLKLFIQVCHAIQHAHQKGIIHRDIKPSNILVSLHDDVPVPKVIDFGIAKAVGARLTDKTVYTRFEQFMGTPAYMSPEQAGRSDLDIDTRSDIYALGVLLYELLAGRPPFDPKQLAEAGLEEMVRCIREEEPLRPSTRLSRLQGEELTTTAQRRGTEPPKLIHLLRGDLDWIVMKCLEKNRTRRYEAANALAQDIERHLNHEPITARPPSTAYRVEKFVRRNKVVVAAGAAVALALMLGIVGSTWQAVRASRQQRRAEANEQKAIKAQASETQLREQAQAQAYASDMNVAWRALKENNLGGVAWLLNAQRPRPGEHDLRNWEWRYLWQACRGEQLWTLRSVGEKVESLCLLPDGRLVSGSLGSLGGVRICDPERREVMGLNTNINGVSGLAVSPDGRRLAAATQDLVVRFLDARSLEVVGEFQHTSPVLKVAFSPDGQLVSASGNEDISVWEVGTRKKLWATRTRIGSVSDAPFLKDGHSVVCTLRDGRLVLLNARDGALLASLGRWANNASTIAVSPDGRRLAAGTWASEVLLIDLSTSATRVLTNHTGPVRAVAFSPDGRQLASGGDDHVLKLWDVESGEERVSLRGHGRGIASLVYSADGRWLFTGGRDGTVRAWDTRAEPKSPSSGLPGGFYAAPVRPDGSRDESVSFFGKRSLSRDGRFLAACSTNGLRRVLSLETLDPIGELQSDGRFRCVSIRPDGREIAAGMEDGTVSVWDLVEGRVSWTFQAHSNEVDVLEFSPDGRRLATASRGAEIRVWNRGESPAMSTWILGETGDHANEMVFFHDGSTLVVPARRQIHLLNLRPGGRDRQIDADKIFCIDISRDDSLVAAGLNDGVRVWDLASSRLVAQLRGSQGEFSSSVAFSPDGRRIVASDNQLVTWLWDLATGREVGRFAGRLSLPYARLQPNGDTLVIALKAGVELLRAPTWKEIDAAEAKEKTVKGSD